MTKKTKTFIELILNSSFFIFSFSLIIARACVCEGILHFLHFCIFASFFHLRNVSTMQPNNH